MPPPLFAIAGAQASRSQPGFDQALDPFDLRPDIRQMAALNISKVAFGCSSLAVLKRRQAGRAESGTVAITTRYRPTRHAELIDGSIFWIIKHRLVARQRIVGFRETADGRWHIDLDEALILVRTRPKRAHQGWRYLKPEDAPADFDGDEDALSQMPPKMLNDLARLALI